MSNSGTPETAVPQYIVAQPAAVMISQPMQQVQFNPYVNQSMVDPVTAFVRTIKSFGMEKEEHSAVSIGGEE